MITFRTKGSFRRTRRMLERAEHCDFSNLLRRYGEEGVRALSAATPVDTGKTAKSWSYEIVEEDGKASIYFTNDNFSKGIPIAILIQYGYATRSGAWVEGRDFINPAVQPIFDRIAAAAWKEVTGK